MHIIGDEIAIFSDIHWGKGRDSQIKLNITNETVDWIIKELNQRKINVAIFLGDWFDNRHSVNVNTCNTSYNAIKRLCKDITVYLIIGNHDCHFKNTNKVHSLSQFSEIENLHIIDNPIEIKFDNDKSGLFCPWQWDIEKYTNKYYDFLFGHFEMNGAALNGTVSSGSTYELKDLLALSKLVFAGHYHLSKEYNFNEGTVITIGCPNELDWGDSGCNKGFYILNTKKGTYKFIENTISPKHIKIYLSTLKNGTQKLTKKILEGNYIKIIVDEDYNYEELTKIMSAISIFKPLQIDQPEFIYSFSQSFLKNMSESSIENASELNISKLDYIMKFIDNIDTNNQQISKEELKRCIEKYYNMCENPRNTTSYNEGDKVINV